MALWTAYKNAFLSEDGRIVDSSAGDRTTSEGQSYAMFFALVADESDVFKSLLNWTERNLAQGDLTATLPAWTWGQRDSGDWGVIDANSATDSDLWIAYALIEAGRIWGRPRYTALGRALSRRVLEEATHTADGQRFLLPAPQGFGPDENGKIVLNPSYSPIFLLDRLLAETGDPAWEALISSAVAALPSETSNRLAPDWIAWQPDRGFHPAPQGSSGSYDAIRVYLWNGLTHQKRQQDLKLLESTNGMAAALEFSLYPPRFVDTASGSLAGTAPTGFSAALLPYLAALKAWDFHAQQMERVIASQQLESGLIGIDPMYYDQNLSLFGLGATSFSFSPQGELVRL